MGWPDGDGDSEAPGDFLESLQRERGDGGALWGLGALAEVGEALDQLELLVDAPGQGEGIETVALGAEPGRCLLGEHPGGDDALKRGLRSIVAALEPGTNPGLGCEFDRWHEQVLQQNAVRVVELVHDREGRRVS